MAIRFAGSQELAQRRRRRLAQEAGGIPIASGTPRASRVTLDAASDGSTGPPRPYSGPRLPRETMIPSNWYVIAALGLLGFALWGTVIWLSQSTLADEYGIRPLVALDQGHIPRYFSTVALLLTAQLSLLIYWHRSRSRKDFLGRYRVWGWAGLFWCLVCLANATQFHVPLLAYLESRYAVNCWRGEHLFWFVPLATGLLALYRLIGRDVNPSRVSSYAWNLAFAIGMIVAGLHFGLELLLPSRCRRPTTVAVIMLWQYSLALFCLIHARYVTHVTNEAGGKRQTIRSRLSRKISSQTLQLGEGILSILWRPRKSSRKADKIHPATAKIRTRKAKSEVKGQIEPADNAPANSSRKSVEAPVAPAVKKKSSRENNGDIEATPARSWSSRIGATLTSRWRQPSQPSPATSDERIVGKNKTSPKTSEKQTSAAADRQPVPPARPVAKPVESAKGTVSTSDEKKPGWSERLRTGLTSRWKRRVDPAQPVTEGNGPHSGKNPANDKQVAPARQPAADASQERKAPSPSQSAQTVRSAPKPEFSRRGNQHDFHEDEEDSEDLGHLSAKERKRLKKRQRQRG